MIRIRVTTAVGEGEILSLGAPELPQTKFEREWSISLPWLDAFFVGSVAEVMEETKRLIQTAKDEAPPLLHQNFNYTLGPAVFMAALRCQPLGEQTK